jgi:hypothetical protein
MKKTLPLFCLLLISLAAFSQDAVSESITTAFKSGSSKELAKYFGSNVELKILNKEEVYSKAQAEIILKDFFTKYPPKNYSSVHKGASKAGSTQYTIGQLITSSGNFRTYYLLRKQGESFIIQELRIEEE